MGSDLSYEDVMENPRLQEVYEATVTGTETIDGQRCWKIDLEAVVEGLAYQSRKLWVDQERGIPLREERFARGGTLLKRVDLTDLRQIGARWFPTHAIYKDVLRAGSGTEFITDEILFDVRIPAHVFTKASLRR